MKNINIDLTTSKAKIARSKKHFDELVSAIKTYLTSQPYAVERTTNDATGDVSDIVRVKKEIPEDWNNIVGDIMFVAGEWSEYPYRDWYYKELKGE